MKGSLACEILKMHGVSEEIFSEAFKARTAEKKRRTKVNTFTPRAEEILSLAAQMAVKYGSDVLGTEHVLLAAKMRRSSYWYSRKFRWTPYLLIYW